MCIDALESTANYLCSGCVQDDAGNDETSEGEWNVTLSFSLSCAHFSSFPMHPCGRIVLVARFLLEICPQIFRTYGLRS